MSILDRCRINIKKYNEDVQLDIELNTAYLCNELFDTMIDLSLTGITDYDTILLELIDLPMVVDVLKDAGFIVEYNHSTFKLLIRYEA